MQIAHHGALTKRLTFWKKFANIHTLAKQHKEQQMSHFSEAVAHAKQLIALGCDRDEAVANTQVAFELDDFTADMVDSNLDLVEAWA
jgi:hypothetical protein